jgi:hypothetical protein
LTPSGRLRPGQKPVNLNNAALKDKYDTFLKDTSVWNVGATANDQPDSTSVTLAEHAVEPLGSTDECAKVKAQNTFTIQYIGMARGELGVLSKREVGIPQVS